MAIIGQDTFVRADQSGWGTASDGETWAQVTGTMTLSIVSNEGQLTGALNASICLLGTQKTWDAESLARVSFSVATDVPALILRYQGASAYYQLDWNAGSLNIHTPAITLASTLFSASINTFYWMRFRVSGNHLYGKMWADGTPEPVAWSVQVADTTFNGSGQFGLRSFGRNTTDIYQWDHFTIDDTVVVAPYPRYVPRGLGATIIPDVVTQPLAYQERGIGSTIIYESRTFVPRALSGVYIPDTVTFVDRPLGGTISISVIATTYAFTDALSISESLLVTENVLPLDVLSATDTTLSADSTISLDSLIASDSGTLQGWGNDGLSASDSLLSTSATLPVDALSSSSIFLDGNTFLPVETTPVSETTLAASTFVPVDANTLTDRMSSEGSTIPTNALSVSETLLTGDAFIPVETNTISEMLLDASAFTSIDANTLIGGINVIGNTIPTDTLAVSENVLTQDTYQPLDTLPVGDVGTLQRWSLDTLSLGDSIFGTQTALPVEGLPGVSSLVEIETFLPVEIDPVIDNSTMVSTSDRVTDNAFTAENDLVITESLLVASEYTGVEPLGITEKMSGSGGIAIQSASLLLSESFLTQGEYATIEGLSTLGTMSASHDGFSTDLNTVVERADLGGLFSPTERLTGVERLVEMDSYSQVEMLATFDTSAMAMTGLLTDNVMAFLDQLSIGDSGQFQRETVPHVPDTVLSPFYDDHMIYFPLFAKYPGI